MTKKIAVTMIGALALMGCVATDPGYDDVSSNESAVEAPTPPSDHMQGDWGWECSDRCWATWTFQWRACDRNNHSDPDDLNWNNVSICEIAANNTLDRCERACELIFQGL